MNPKNLSSGQVAYAILACAHSMLGALCPRNYLFAVGIMSILLTALGCTLVYLAHVNEDGREHQPVVLLGLVAFAAAIPFLRLLAVLPAGIRM